MYGVSKNELTGRVRPLVVKYNEAISWYPHNIVKPNLTTSCGTKCHYAGNLLGASFVPVELTSFTAQSENQKVVLQMDNRNRT
ncbi:MAG: hypothetical protein MZV64_32205 [Ignavibacteriales bacterium]|nr:hypothetical protein [Ignavibacteriales bacterium]